MQLNRYEMSCKENIYALIDLFTAYFAVDLYESIDEGKMLEAVKEAIKYHPLFGTRIVFENGLYYFEENPEEPVIFNTENAPGIYGKAENHGYPWMIVLQNKRMLFYSIHALTDGVGIFSFCKTVLHIYFKLRGVVFADTAMDFPKGSPEQTMENAFLRYADPECKAFGMPKFSSPVDVAPDWFEPKARRPWRLVIPSDEVRRFARNSETSVFSVIACILARTMADAFDIQDGNIYIRVPVNLRSSFPTATDRNFVQGFSLCYDAQRLKDMPDAMVETAFRSQLDLWTDKDNLVQFINRDIERINRMKANPEEMRAVLASEQTKKSRAEILYTHITRPEFSKELMDRISDMHLAFNAVIKETISILGITFGSDITLVIQQSAKNDCFIESLRKMLNKREISYDLYQFELAAAYTCRKTSELMKNG